MSQPRTLALLLGGHRRAAGRRPPRRHRPVLLPYYNNYNYYFLPVAVLVFSLLLTQLRLLPTTTSSSSSSSVGVVGVQALPFRGGGSSRASSTTAEEGDVDDDDDVSTKQEEGVQEAVVPPHHNPQQEHQDPVPGTPIMIHIVRRGAAAAAAAGAASASTTTTTTRKVASSSTRGRPHRRRNALVDMFMTTMDPVDNSTNSADNDEWMGHASVQMLHEIRNMAHNLTDSLVNWRRTLHKYPELMYQEKQTSAFVQSVLDELGVEYTTGWGKNRNNINDEAATTTLPRPDGPGGYGIVAELGTGHEPCILLRADMDALPIHERTVGIDDYKSVNDGVMHACGHDGHTTMLLGAVAVLKSMEGSIPGTIRFMFQPAEEGGAGAKRMREEGVLTLPPKPSHAFAIHVWPTLPSGVIASRPGPLLAACERFEILIAGVGGHAAMPHLTVDPIVTASAIVMNLQHIVSRTVSPLESGVVSITKFEAGDAFNVIPASAVLRGTIRALSTPTLLELRERVERVVQSTSAAHGCNVTILYSPDYYPPTVNDPTLYASFSQHVARLVTGGGGGGVDDGTILDVEPTMGAEDFSFVAESIPSTFFLLGQGGGGRRGCGRGGGGGGGGGGGEASSPTNYGLHHPHFNLDESVLSQGVELHVNLALRALRRLHHIKEEGRGKESSTSSYSLYE